MKSKDIKVFISSRESVCDECHENLGKGAWITLWGEKGALCLSCSDLDHLIFLPSGNTALTRRARKKSILVAVVLKWSKARKRYERQGLLVESKALEAAEFECLADHEIRMKNRERAAIRRKELDQTYIREFSEKIRKFFPNCPKSREKIIAQHACQKYSGRVGRSATAKKFDKDTILLAVIAHIRHAETNYDLLLAQGHDRFYARQEVKSEVERKISKWMGRYNTL